MLMPKRVVSIYSVENIIIIIIIVIIIIITFSDTIYSITSC